MCGFFPESEYNVVHTRQMLDDFYPRALQWCSFKQIPNKLVNIDICKCYPSVLLNNCEPIPVYTIHDVVRPFGTKDELRSCGEAFLDEVTLKIFGFPLKIEAGFYTNNLVFFLVDELFMSTKYIKHIISSKKALKPDTFSEFIKFIFDNFDEGDAKRLASSFIGELGRKYNRHSRGFTCTDYETAMCCWTSTMAEKKNVTVDFHNDIFLIKEEKIERIFKDSTSFNRFVVSQSILKLVKLMRANCGKDSKIYGYNTDGFFISNPKIKYENKKDVVFKTENIGKAYSTNSTLNYFEKHYRENMVEDYVVKEGDGCIFTGQAGSGKTTKLVEMVNDNSIVLSFINKAIENVKSRLSERANLCFTFDSYFCEWKGRDVDSLEGKTIFIEEYSMVPI